MNPLFLNQWVIFILGKLGHLTCYVVIPAFIIPWPQLVRYDVCIYILYRSFLSLLFTSYLMCYRITEHYYMRTLIMHFTKIKSQNAIVRSQRVNFSADLAHSQRLFTHKMFYIYSDTCSS